MTRIAVDFDNTLTTGNVAYWDGEEPEPDEDMIDWVNQRYFEGATVIVWTARHEGVRARTERWLREWGLHYHALVMDKLSADVYVDDKAALPDAAKEMDSVPDRSAMGDIE